MSWWRRIVAVLGYAWKLYWRTEKMPLTLETLSDIEIAALLRQAEREDVPFEQWARNQLLKGVDKQTGAQVKPSAAAMLAASTAAFAELDAGDVDLEGTAPDPESVGDRGTFGIAPGEPHARTRQTELSKGPLASRETVTSHPCRHLGPEVPPNFTFNDCQGTCHHPQRAGSPCQWPPSSARGCPAFLAKILPRPAPAREPRQL